MKLTPNMRTVLTAAAKQELRRPPRNPWPAPWQTLHALVNHGLLQANTRKNRAGHDLNIWTITDTGRAALEPREIFRREALVYLARPTQTSGDFTTIRNRSIDETPVTDPGTLDDAWVQLREQRQADARDRITRARQAARNARYAA